MLCVAVLPKYRGIFAFNAHFQQISCPRANHFRVVHSKLPEGCSPCHDPGSRQQSVTFCDPFTMWLLLLFPGFGVQYVLTNS